MILNFKNETEQKVLDIIKPKMFKFYSFSRNETFEHYTLYRNVLGLKKSDLWVFANVPKTYGICTSTELVLVGKGFDARLDCKRQTNKGSHITIDNIEGEIRRNTIVNRLFEKELLFVVEGEGIDWMEMKAYRKTLPKHIKILSIKEFIKYFKEKLG